MGYRSVFRDGLFSGQNIIVTGAGTGIGRCTAHEIAGLGGHVVVAGRTREKLDAVCAEIAQAGGEASALPLDIRDEDAVREQVAAVVEQRGRIHGLVNNAGGQFSAPLAAISKKGWDAVVATNLTGGFLVARECFVQSMADHGGSVVNIVADMWGGMPGMAHSGAARAGMVNFTETAALEWAVSNVRVNAVAPGWIASSGMDRYPESMHEILRKLPGLCPLKRMGTESEVSAAIVFLLSEAAAFISGATLRVDGAVPNIRPMWEVPEHPPAPAYDGFHLSTTPRVYRDDDKE